MQMEQSDVPRFAPNGYHRIGDVPNGDVNDGFHEVQKLAEMKVEPADPPVGTEMEVETETEEQCNISFPWNSQTSASPPEHDSGMENGTSSGHAGKPSISRQQTDLIAYKDAIWNAVTLRNGELASRNILQLYRDLESWISRPRQSASTKAVAEELRLALPDQTTVSNRQPVFAAFSTWFESLCRELTQQTWLRHVDALKTLRFVLPCTQAEDDLKGPMEVMFEGILSPHVMVRVSALQCVTHLAELHEQPLPQLFRQNTYCFGPLLARSLLGKPVDQVTTILSVCIHVFHMGNLQDMLRPVMPHLLHALIRDGSDAAVGVIRHVAALTTKKPGELLRGFLEQVVPVLIAESDDQATLEKGVAVIEKITGWNRTRLLGGEHAVHVIYNQLFLNVSVQEKKKAVWRGVQFLAEQQGVQLDIDSSEGLKKLADHIQPQFLGFIFFAESIFLDPNSHMRAKRNVLQSLARLIMFMESRHMSSVRTKLLATLKTVLQNAPTELLAECFATWKAFLRTLKTASLKPILCQIVVILLPFVKSEPEHVVSIFEYLIIENEKALRDHFQELFFIPDIPALQEVNVVLRKYIQRSEEVDHDHFAENVKEAVDFVDITDRNYSESSTADLPTLTLPRPQERRCLRIPQIEVKQYALKKLKLLVRNNQEALYKMIGGGDPRHTRPESISCAQIISVLMNGCREAHSATERQGFGEVLGAIGAIDPDDVEVTTDLTRTAQGRSAFFASIHDPAFGANFIKELVKSYMTAERTSTQDRCGFVIQQTLEFYKLSDPVHRARHDEWTELETSEYWEVLTPFLTSKYRMLPDEEESQYETPIFGSSHSLTFSDWIRNWAVALIDQITVQSPTAKFFIECGKLLIYDLSRSVILLPHIVVYLLVFGEEQAARNVQKEMMTVLECHDHPQIYSDMDLRHFATQTVVSLLAFLREWCSNSKRRNSKKVVQDVVQDELLLVNPQEASTDRCDVLRSQVGRFLVSIPDDLVARACFNCGAYAKALLHYEKFLRKACAPKKDDTFRWVLDDSRIQFLQRVYVALEDEDGIRGLNARRTSEPLLEDRVVAHLSSGNLQEALVCYEQLAQLKVEDDRLAAGRHADVARCLLDLDEPSTAMAYCNGGHAFIQILSETSDWMAELNPLRVEAAWKLSRWDVLEKYIDAEGSNQNSLSQWSIGVGRLFLAAKHSNSQHFQQAMGQLRAQLMGPVCAASMEKRAYHRAYDHLVQLHILQELEEGSCTWFGITPDEEFRCTPKSQEQLLAEWKLRLNFTQSSYHNVQKILTVRRIVLEAAQKPELNGEIGSCWLQSAKMARKSNHLQTAYSFLLNSMPYQTPEFASEQAKYLWTKGEHDQALASLEKTISDSRFRSMDNLRQGKVKLLAARYLDESRRLESSQLSERYQQIVELAPEIEKSHFFLGKFHDKVLESLDKKQLHGEQTFLVIEQFVTSLKYGCRYIHQSLPRLLTLWLDFGTTLADTARYPAAKRGKSTVPPALLDAFRKIQDQIRTAIKTIPKYVFLIAFPQLVSRICVSHDEAAATLIELIVKVTIAYPQVAMWHLVPLCLAVTGPRQDILKLKYQRIMELIKKEQKENQQFFGNMEAFCDQLQVLCNLYTRKNDPMAGKLSERSETKRLRKLLDDDTWMHPILPFQEFMVPQLPSSDASASYRASAENERALRRNNSDDSVIPHEPFATQPITIWKLEDEFTVMSSLQKPKKVTVITSAGQKYTLMLKPKDDLRKDARFMELADLINKFLREDSESRRRQLHIRTYSVTPINEECGIVEWVPDTHAQRSLITDAWRMRGVEFVRADLNPLMGMRDAPIETRMTAFRTLKGKYPPLLWEWMQRQYPDATVWLVNRLTFARTAAVMSIVGYIMGLGDRHPENLLMISDTATVMHCDFSCLFNKGELLEWPERVPFRLTQNMVDAMGPLGVEGFFRQACELTLNVIREHKDATMSVLKVFLYDPLLEWTPVNKAGGSKDHGENVEARKSVERIEKRISGQILTSNRDRQTGTVLSGNDLSLSVPGQVDYLINEASSDELLCQMYIGWSPHL